MAKKPTLSPEDRRWRAESALRTLTEAESIRSNAGLMRDVARHAQAQVKTLTKVATTPAKKPPARKK